MNEYTLSESVFLTPTPKGAYYATASPEPEAARAVLRGLMAREETRPASLDEIGAWTGESDSLPLLYRMERADWLTGATASTMLVVRNLETDMPVVLERLSEEGRALLADTQGFTLAQAGFHHEIAEELALLGAEIANLQFKYNKLIRGNLRLPSAAMGLLDSAGNSQLGIWPLFIGSQQFLLMVQGMPKFDQPAFLQMAWSLCWRYGS